jgi:hypothetical protein
VVGGRIEHFLCPPPAGQIVPMILGVVILPPPHLRSLAGIACRRIHKKSAAAEGPPILMVDGYAPPA